MGYERAGARAAGPPRAAPHARRPRRIAVRPEVCVARCLRKAHTRKSFWWLT